MANIKSGVTKWGRQQRQRSKYLTKQRATEAQWGLVDLAIKAFINKYPHHWMEFQNQLKFERSDYQLATREHKALRKANWRNTASFPIIEDRQGKTIDALLPVIEKIIPNLVDKDSVNYAAFLKRYPMFLPGEKF